MTVYSMDSLKDVVPEIQTPLPGPNAAALIERDKACISPSYTRMYPLAIRRGEGAIVEDVDGNRFLDYCAGIAVCSTGHSHPEVVQAIKEQAEHFLHMSGTDFYYQSMVDLAERLVRLTPGSPDKKVFFANSGAEANEGAIKLARYYTGRDKIVACYRSFHGRTYAAMSCSASKTIHKKGFGPLLPGIYHTHYPYHYRNPMGASPEETAEQCLAYIENHIFKYLTPPEEVAAFLVEPIQGEGGYIVPPDNFLPGLQALARKYGILVIADEVQSGMGRTGKMWASQHFNGFEPDILTSAKGLASGMPLGAFIARSEIMSWTPGAHATTFGGNPVCCAAAIKTVDLVEHGLMQNAARQGAYLMEQLRRLQERYEVIGDIRGFGLMIGLELVSNPKTKEKASQLRDQLIDRCFEHGLLILGCGDNTIRFSPPLIISERQTDIALEIFERTLKSLI